MTSESETATEKKVFFCLVNDIWKYRLKLKHVTHTSFLECRVRVRQPLVAWFLCLIIWKFPRSIFRDKNADSGNDWLPLRFSKFEKKNKIRNITNYLKWCLWPKCSKIIFGKQTFQFLFARESQIAINYRQIARSRGAVRSARRIINGE